MICNNCGKEIQGQVKFCVNCGQAITTLATDQPAQGAVPNTLQGAVPNTPNTAGGGIKKWKIISIALVVVIIAALAGSVSIYNKYHTEKETVKRFISAVESENNTEILDLLEPSENTVNLDGVSRFVKWVNESSERLEEIKYSLLESDSQEVSTGTGRENGYKIVEHKKFLFLNDYRIQVKPGSLKVSAAEGTKVTISGLAESFKVGSNEFVKINSLLPGAYNVKLSKDTPFGPLTGEENINLNAGETVETDMHSSLNGATYDVTTNYYVSTNDQVQGGKIFLDNKDTGISLGQNVPVGPVPAGEHNVTVKLKYAWGEYVVSGKTSAEQGEQRVILSPDAKANASIMKTLSQVIDQFNIADTKAKQTLDVSKELLLCYPNGPLYTKVKDSISGQAQSFAYKKLIFSPNVRVDENNKVTVTSAEWYAYPEGENTVVWDYQLIYESGKWLIYSNTQVSRYPDNQDFVTDPNRIEITH